MIDLRAIQEKYLRATVSQDNLEPTEIPTPGKALVSKVGASSSVPGPSLGGVELVMCVAGGFLEKSSAAKKSRLSSKEAMPECLEEMGQKKKSK
ncbi:hypothetical protein NDU88_004107 [Pleurodeles waltl]|uniref:Uncharacterized protein n=1 Tax=Pleurodeles waltl TaxID=8319 RepID=A0AAV7QDL6_PLEWA|nr:hypothetical protein NDU88_004107 [Pleurodeles waltl]